MAVSATAAPSRISRPGSTWCASSRRSEPKRQRSSQRRSSSGLRRGQGLRTGAIAETPNEASAAPDGGEHREEEHNGDDARNDGLANSGAFGEPRRQKAGQRRHDAEEQ